MDLIQITKEFVEEVYRKCGMVQPSMIACDNNGNLATSIFDTSQKDRTAFDDAIEAVETFANNGFTTREFAVIHESVVICNGKQELVASVTYVSRLHQKCFIAEASGRDIVRWEDIDRVIGTNLVEKLNRVA